MPKSKYGNSGYGSSMKKGGSAMKSGYGGKVSGSPIRGKKTRAK